MLGEDVDDWGLTLSYPRYGPDGQKRDYSLVPDGANIALTNANKELFLKRYVQVWKGVLKLEMIYSLQSLGAPVNCQDVRLPQIKHNTNKLFGSPDTALQKLTTLM